jgi:hypothetical protein
MNCGAVVGNEGWRGKMWADPSQRTSNNVFFYFSDSRIMTDGEP